MPREARKGIHPERLPHRRRSVSRLGRLTSRASTTEEGREEWRRVDSVHNGRGNQQTHPREVQTLKSLVLFENPRLLAPAPSELSKGNLKSSAASGQDHEDRAPLAVLSRSAQLEGGEVFPPRTLHNASCQKRALSQHGNDRPAKSGPKKRTAAVIGTAGRTNVSCQARELPPF